MAGYRKLSRNAAQRKALIRNQVTALINNGKIVTTEAKAKEIRKVAEHLIALAVREKDNFEEKKRIELNQIAADKEKLSRDIESFEANKKLTNEKFENTKRSLQMEQEQFAKYKELEQKKMDLEEKNLQASCARFKELVSQYCQAAPSELTGDKRFREDLDFSSLDFMSFLDKAFLE